MAQSDGLWGGSWEALVLLKASWGPGKRLVVLGYQERDLLPSTTWTGRGWICADIAWAHGSPACDLSVQPGYTWVMLAKPRQAQYDGCVKGWYDVELYHFLMKGSGYESEAGGQMSYSPGAQRASIYRLDCQGRETSNEWYAVLMGKLYRHKIPCSPWIDHGCDIKCL